MFKNKYYTKEQMSSILGISVDTINHHLKLVKKILKDKYRVYIYKDYEKARRKPRYLYHELILFMIAIRTSSEESNETARIMMTKMRSTYE